MSDEFYHELTMLHPELPRSYKVKAARRRVSDTVEFLPLPSPFHGYHTFAAVRSAEDYDSLRKSFEPVFSEMNKLIRDGKVNVNGMSIKYWILFLGVI